MGDWRQKLGIYLFIVGIFLPVLFKCHSVPAPKNTGFLRYTTGYPLVKVIDTVGAESIFRFSDGITLLDVKNMTLKSVDLDSTTHSDWSRRLKDGDIVDFTNKSDKAVGITVKSMSVVERIVLGIPLDPDTMTLNDWLSLPGIGRSLAKTIVVERQKNGEYHSFEMLMRVPGIGVGRINSLKKLFRYCN